MNYYVGIDLHKQHSSVAVIDKEGKLIDQRKLYHTAKQEFLNYFSSFDKNTSVSVEATANWYWLVDALQELGLDVKLVHAKKARIIAESTIKSDKIDSRILAHLDRCNFLPQAYIANKDVRSSRELLRHYMSLVKIRTSVKNRIHWILAKNNICHGFSDLFGKKGITFLKELELPEIFKFEMDGYISLLEHLNQRIKEIQKEIRNRCKESSYSNTRNCVPHIITFSK